MEIHGFQTVKNLPCLYHPELDLLVISDLHLGLEATMTSKGNYVPRHQLDNLLDDIRSGRKETEASRVLVNGDLKNEYKTSYSETQEIEKLFKFLKEEFEETVIIKGNHDTFIDSTAEKHGLAVKDFHNEAGILFIHGDRALENFEVGEFKTLVIGHEHPALALKDDIGVREKVDCFLYGKTLEDENFIVLPAFSHISNGTSINEVPERQLLSPILKNRVSKDTLKAVAVSREAGILEFPELGKI